MLDARDGFDKTDGGRISDIGRTCGSKNSVLDLQPSDELARTLRGLCRRGTSISSRTPQRSSAGVTIDLAVAGPHGTFGIVCDAMDAARLRSRPGCLGELGLDRVYCVSALDSLLDPAGVARAITKSEPGYFRRTRSGSAAGSLSVEAWRVDFDKPATASTVSAPRSTVGRSSAARAA